jgi:hypothetical protein
VPLRHADGVHDAQLLRARIRERRRRHDLAVVVVFRRVAERAHIR